MKGKFVMTESNVAAKKFITSRNDAMFKTIICDEHDTRYLKKILEVILNIEILNITFMKSERPKINVHERTKIVDLLVKTLEKKIIHVELNNVSRSTIRFRNYCFFSNVIATETKVGENYDIKKEFIHIDLTYDMPKKDKEVMYEYYVQTIKMRKYVDNVKIIEVNMDLIKKSCYNKEEYKYLAMLDMTPEDLNKYRGDYIIMTFKERLEEVNQDEDMYRYMSSEKMAQMEYNTDIACAKEEGFESGMKSGEIKGAENARKQMIISMHKNGMEEDDIAKMTGLSKSDVLMFLNN